MLMRHGIIDVKSAAGKPLFVVLELHDPQMLG